MIRIEEFISDEDVSPFRRWFDALDHQAAAWVTIAIDRLGEGNTSNAKALADLNKATELAPDDALSLYLRGLVRQKTGDAQGGEVDIAAARKIDPQVSSSVQ